MKANKHPFKSVDLYTKTYVKPENVQPKLMAKMINEIAGYATFSTTLDDFSAGHMHNHIRTCFVVFNGFIFMALLLNNMQKVFKSMDLVEENHFQLGL